MTSDVNVTNEWDEMARGMVHEALWHEDTPYQLGGTWKRVEHYKRGDSSHTLWITFQGVPTQVRAECDIKRTHIGAVSGPYFQGKVSIMMVNMRPPQPTYEFECNYSNGAGIVIEPLRSTKSA